jgi:hypothetical protein
VHGTLCEGGSHEKTNFKLKSKNFSIALMSINVNKLQKIFPSVIGR